MALRQSIKEFSNYLGEKNSILDDNYRHIADKIELHWGYDEFYPFIDKLLVDTRDHKRAGFPDEAAKEIMELIQIHERLHPRKNNFF